MKHAFFLLSLTLFGWNSMAQDQGISFRTYSHDSTVHYFLGVRGLSATAPDMPNPLENMDLRISTYDPFILDPLNITDFPEFERHKQSLPSDFQKYDFQKPDRFKNELNFNPKLRQ